jgi:glycyl-tRNA synthetase beta chain
MPELLLEILSEEIPARMQARAAEDLRRLVTERLTGAGLAFKEARAYVTPRRLALAVTSLPVKQPNTLEEKKGPRLGAPKKAIQGFLKGNGLRSLDEAELRETDKGSFYFLARKRKGQASAKVLPGIIVEAIQALGWPKSMRWGDGKFVWVPTARSCAARWSWATAPRSPSATRPSATVSWRPGSSPLRASRTTRRS